MRHTCMRLYHHMHVLSRVLLAIAESLVNYIQLLRRRSRQRKSPYATGLSICLIRLFVCSSVAKMRTKMRFSQKQNNLELWSLLTPYRKSIMVFSKNSLLNP